MYKIRLKTLHDTAVFANHLAQEIAGGQVFFLNGDLGVGKTALVKAIGQSLGIDASLIQSPTFTYFNLFEDIKNGPALFHADLYRLEHYDSLHNIGFWDYCENPEYVAFIEWANKFEQLSHLERFDIFFQFASTSSERIIIFDAFGLKYKKIHEKIKNALSDHGLDIL
ncbi:MAG TPA: tRNA (adenosine(37)-N6)-threonylcarbamoyltransferase complex ATPase subunit type 1 TsaE [Oligoflexia bacterium]|nr:tRNA (adenosine(37)-N6)-threonylcarbamoyltransferase complex ATPase subunit type 1 TsaE [Oligoflexia bacterium]HMR24165.1 tRNA (adenosine(37)-N6)-threonylcarbamoyltransferase complex ATPase subunit type 1 TsaE [Oligoflexia bacterium]